MTTICQLQYKNLKTNSTTIMISNTEIAVSNKNVTSFVQVYYLEVLFVIFLGFGCYLYRKRKALSCMNFEKYRIVIPEDNARILCEMMYETCKSYLCSICLIVLLSVGNWILTIFKDYWFYRVALAVFCAFLISKFHFLRYGTY